MLGQSKRWFASQPWTRLPLKPTDTPRAGAEIIAAAPRNETVIFIKKRLRIMELMPFFEDFDYVILEGFKSEKNLPKIIAAKTAEEAKQYLDVSVVAISGLIMESEEELRKAMGFKVPMCKSLAQTGELADLVEKKAVTHDIE